MSNRVLMIAFHYPPCATSSGLQRTLSFTRYLGRYGWQPALVTASPRSYEVTSDAQLAAIPVDMPIRRAFALDAARHLSIAGRYPARLAVPDRWSSWRYTGVRAALELVRRYRPHAVWSTYPLATAHMIAAAVAKRTGLPWIADMRDPMVEYDDASGQHFPPDRKVREARLRIEREAVEHAHIVFCTYGAEAICRERYKGSVEVRSSIIHNGYDEAEFQAASSSARRAPSNRGFTLVHSGTVYPGTDRGPDALFEALRLLDTAHELPAGFSLIMRAAGHEKYVRELIERTGVAHLVRIASALPYQAALAEMCDSDALLVLQGRTSNPAIPAKTYEYLRARKPILALAHPAGDTARLLEELRAAVLAPLDDSAAIVNAFRELFGLIAAGKAPIVADTALKRFARDCQAQQLAEVLSRVVANVAPAGS